MSSATNMVDLMSARSMSTAAMSVSFTAGLKLDAKPVDKSFDNILNNVTKQNTTEVKPKEDIAGTKDVKSDTKDNKAGIKDIVKSSDDGKANVKNDTKTVKQDETNGKEADNELQNAISEEGKKLIQEIADTLDISEDEIIAAMQMLGITDMQLLVPKNIVAVINEISPVEDKVDLIVDETLSDNLQDIFQKTEEAVNNITEEFDISKEELEALVQPKEEPVKEVVQEKEAVVTVINNEASKDVNKEAVKETTQAQTKTIEVESEETFDTTFKPVEESKDTSKNETKDFSNSGQGASPFNQLLNNIVNAAEENQVQAANPYVDRTQMENIVRQITDRITIMRGPEETSLELSLHPASLGNVNVLLSSTKDGIVAKFTAQNQIVKEAVESQMVQLQQKFNEQGIKVTSIEITIASHAFEQNLEQQNHDQSGQEEAKGKTKGLRRINLSMTEDDEEELSEADALTREMMYINGNSVDFSA